jgi:golgi-specific brefeldin A-resistance guanine nucleotide exchange factor 1
VSCERIKRIQSSGVKPIQSNENSHSALLSDVDKWCLEGFEDEETESFTNAQSLTSESTEDMVESNHLFTSKARSADVLRQRKLKKQRLRLAAEKFNEKPLNHDWVRFAADLSLLPKIPIGTEPTSGGAGAGLCDARNIALFLKSTPGLGKTQIGEYLSRGPWDKYPFHAEVLKEYVNTFDYGSTSFVEALRLFLGQFRLPGEARCIDRLMEAFSTRILVFWE